MDTLVFVYFSLFVRTSTPPTLRVCVAHTTRFEGSAVLDGIPRQSVAWLAELVPLVGVVSRLTWVPGGLTEFTVTVSATVIALNPGWTTCDPGIVSMPYFNSSR